MHYMDVVFCRFDADVFKKLYSNWIYMKNSSLAHNRKPLCQQFNAGVLIVATTISSCTTITKSDLAKRDDYLPSMYMLSQASIDQAARRLPEKESGGFICTNKLSTVLCVRTKVQ